MSIFIDRQVFVDSLREIYGCSEADAVIAMDLTAKCLNDVQAKLNATLDLEPTGQMLSALAAGIFRVAISLHIAAYKSASGKHPTESTMCNLLTRATVLSVKKEYERTDD